MKTKLFAVAAPKAALGCTLALTAVVLGGLLVGIEPVGGDPDRMYRPMKAELARSLAEGGLPYWSDRIGLGFPLVAESHAAAFYPPNQLLYRVFSVPLAYRLAMFLHYSFLAGATYAYARRLGLTSSGSALAALSFTFCGFQSIHSSHEVFYHALPYLPLCLLLAEWIMAEGRPVGAAALALAYGLQLTVGHFQVQSWTAGLVVATGIWRAIGTPRRAWRVALLLLGLGWGAAIAAVQLGPSWELARFVGQDERPFLALAFYGFPPAHWAELVVPGWLRGIPGGPEANYWYALGTTGYEACFYIGTIPLIFAFVGVMTKPNSGSRFWIGVALATFVLAILPGVWLQGFAWVAALPGMGLFRAPGRFLAVTSLGLAILAGKGLDRGGSRALAWLGLGLAVAFAAGGTWWVASWSWRADHIRELGGDRLLIRLATAAGAWLIAAVLAAGWLRGRVPARVLLVATAAELGTLYYTSTTEWGWAASIPESSPVLTKLAEEEGAGRLVGLLSDIPLRLGMGPLFPYTGFAPPDPHPSLAGLAQRNVSFPGYADSLIRHYGATHGVWDGPIDSATAELILTSRDETLDRVVHKPVGAPAHATWRLYRFTDPAPMARAVGKAIAEQDGRRLMIPDRSVVRYRVEEMPPPDQRPNATRAEVVSWDGRTATVEHDGPCDVVLNRTFYPGWMSRIEGDAERPVRRADAGVQAAHVPGAGVHQVTFTYRPTNLLSTVLVSAGALASALVLLGWDAARRHRLERRTPTPRMTSPRSIA
ncbi:hypothetical protein [Paludisphaera soli]|uniref:hypothetical protein n=1 Tax=Paludisphaera soli TaxID=2712865 RepID=UPI0013EE0AA2|nr:hypothetical protein [Paludisphaera soli]